MRPTVVKKGFRSLQAANKFLETIKSPEQYVIVQLVAEVLSPDVAIIGYMIDEAKLYVH